MSWVDSAEAIGVRGRAPAGPIDWLCLAATPTFAILALLSGLLGGPMDRLCSSGGGAPLSGMTLMYALMSAFHAPPWLRLVFGPRDHVPQTNEEIRRDHSSGR